MCLRLFLPVLGMLFYCVASSSLNNFCFILLCLDLIVLSAVSWKSVLSDKGNKTGVDLGKRESMRRGKEQQGRETIVGIYEREVCFE